MSIETKIIDNTGVENASESGFNTEEMTIHKALATLKILKDRIDRAISNINLVCAIPGNKKQDALCEDFLKTGKANLTSLIDMVSRYNAIKAAIIASNAVTTVSVRDLSSSVAKIYTIAEIVAIKDNYLVWLKELLNKLSRQYAAAESLKHDIDNKAEKNALAMFGARSAEAITNTTDTNEGYQTFLRNNGGIILEAIDSKKTISDLQTAIDNFIADADAALSVSNAVTTITIKYQIGKTFDF